jgi:hypothetical protein
MIKEGIILIATVRMSPVVVNNFPLAAITLPTTTFLITAAPKPAAPVVRFAVCLTAPLTAACVMIALQSISPLIILAPRLAAPPGKPVACSTAVPIVAFPLMIALIMMIAFTFLVAANHSPPTAGQITMTAVLIILLAPLAKLIAEATAAPTALATAKVKAIVP